MQTIVAADMSWINYKSHFVFKHFSVQIGDREVKTGTMFGFINFVKQIRKRFKDIEIIFCLDSAKNLKEEKYTFYKENRKSDETAWVLYDENVNLLSGMNNVKLLRAEGFEGDDVIGYVVRKYSANNEVVIFSSDKDMRQLLHYPNTSIVTSTAFKDEEVLTKEKIIGQYGIEPKQLLLFRSLLGDGSDGIPKMMPRFPKKLAVELAKRYEKPDDILTEVNFVKGDYHKKLAESDMLEKWRINYELTKLADLQDSQIEILKPEFKGFEYFMTRYQLTSLRDLAQSDLRLGS